MKKWFIVGMIVLPPIIFAIFIFSLFLPLVFVKNDTDYSIIEERLEEYGLVVSEIDAPKYTSPGGGTEATFTFEDGSVFGLGKNAKVTYDADALGDYPTYQDAFTNEVFMDVLEPYSQLYDKEYEQVVLTAEGASVSHTFSLQLEHKSRTLMLRLQELSKLLNYRKNGKTQLTTDREKRKEARKIIESLLDSHAISMSLSFDLSGDGLKNPNPSNFVQATNLPVGTVIHFRADTQETGATTDYDALTEKSFMVDSSHHISPIEQEKDSFYLVTR